MVVVTGHICWQGGIGTLVYISIDFLPEVPPPNYQALGNVARTIQASVKVKRLVYVGTSPPGFPGDNEKKLDF